MEGIPWELDRLPRHRFHNPKEQAFKPHSQPKPHDRIAGSPGHALHLDTIAEAAAKPRSAFFGGSNKSGTTTSSSFSPTAETPANGLVDHHHHHHPHSAPPEAST